MAACCEENFFGADSLFTAIVEDDFGFALGQEMGSAVDIFNFVVFEVLFVYPVQSSDVGVALVLERCEIERRDLFDVEPVRLSLVKRLGNGSCVPGDLFRDTPSTG